MRKKMTLDSENMRRHKTYITDIGVRRGNRRRRNISGTSKLRPLWRRSSGASRARLVNVLLRSHFLDFWLPFRGSGSMRRTGGSSSSDRRNIFVVTTEGNQVKQRLKKSQYKRAKNKG